LGETGHASQLSEGARCVPHRPLFAVFAPRSKKQAYENAPGKADLTPGKGSVCPKNHLQKTGGDQMVVEQTLEKLRAMKLYGMDKALEQQREQPEVASLSFEDRFGLLVDQEWTFRENRKLDYRLRSAKEAAVEQIDYRIPRNLNKSLLLSLANSDWVAKRQNIIITGPTGSGKSFLACALAHKACRDGYTALYKRAPMLLYELSLARADGSYGRLLQKLAHLRVLVVDDWGLAPLEDRERRDFLEILEDRHNAASTIMTSQLPIKQWHDLIGDPTLADAICDRIVHNAHKIMLKGESVRKMHASLD
jgi:DNA replication protein DnaC